MTEDVVQRLTRERDEARANYAFMVQRACDERLEGYRELGDRCARLHEQLDQALNIIRAAQAVVAKRMRYQDRHMQAAAEAVLNEMAAALHGGVP